MTLARAHNRDTVPLKGQVLISHINKMNTSQRLQWMNLPVKIMTDPRTLIYLWKSGSLSSRLTQVACLGDSFPSFTISPLSPVPTVRAGCTGVCSRHSQIFSHRSKAMETRAGNLRSAMFWRLSWPFTYEISSCKQVVRSCFVQRECFKEHGKWFFQFRDSSGARSPWKSAEIVTFEIT